VLNAVDSSARAYTHMYVQIHSLRRTRTRADEGAYAHAYLRTIERQGLVQTGCDVFSYKDKTLM